MRHRTLIGLGLCFLGASCLTLALAGTDAPQPADVTARHVQEAPEETEFRSPMEVEGSVVVPGLDPARSNQPVVSIRDFARFTCDDVTLKELTLEVRKPRKGEKGLPVKVTANLFTRQSHDRRVDLNISFLHDGQVVGTALLERIDAEENKKAKKSIDTVLRVEPGAESVPLDLRIRMEVEVD